MSKNKKDLQPFWRPNFANPATLPDIKAVRTDFIINSIALTLLLLMGFYIIQKEYRAYALKKTISSMEQQIRVAQPDDNANLKLSSQFRDGAAHVAELEEFYQSPVLAHDFLFELAQMRPEDLIFQQVSFQETIDEGKNNSKQVGYRILISGDVRSLTVLDEFKGLVGEWDRLNLEGYALEIDEAVQGRDANTGIFPYSLRITLTPEKASGKAANGGEAKS